MCFRITLWHIERAIMKVEAEGFLYMQVVIGNKEFTLPGLKYSNAMTSYQHAHNLLVSTCLLIAFCSTG